MEILLRRKKEAEKEGRKVVFTLDKSVLPTATISNALMKVAGRTQLNRHVTSHSARKGAATEAVLAGVPLTVVKSMGHWMQIDTLEKYIGDTIRRQVALLPFIAGVSI